MGGCPLTLTSMHSKKAKNLFNSLERTRNRQPFGLTLKMKSSKLVDTYGNALRAERSLNYFTIDAHLAYKINYVTIELASLILELSIRFGATMRFSQNFVYHIELGSISQAH